jgi:hypothetical protein
MQLRSFPWHALALSGLLFACDSSAPCDTAPAPDASFDAGTLPPHDGGTEPPPPALDASTEAGSDAQIDARGRCTAPLDCGQSTCRPYEPLTRCPGHGQVREGFCGFGDELRLRISFDGGGEYIEYWDVDTGELVAIDRGSDIVQYCDGTSARILIGDLGRIEACEASRGEQLIVCDGEERDGGGDAG